MDWQAKLAEYETLVTGREALVASGPGGGEREDLVVSSIATAAWAAGLAALMVGDAPRARAWLVRAAEVYRRSFALAPPGSWGRPLATIRCRLVAGDLAGARADAGWALATGAGDAASATARYAAALALLALGRDDEAAGKADALAADPGFRPHDVALALVALARADAPAYAEAVEGVLADFEARDAFLEDARVADTVLVLDRLAEERGLERPRRPSPLLPDG